ncbi:carbohydrate esterase family 16 protein [Myriangium duriaei CBS 260.36]|uniref:Carbohydrate esterase family 16 protein n=1 Tax=Myriangium duriaei CBS 260.36 TaxID=1168546 RepID=A0A9P4J474_9PEZI|nr:carbohydrate esterase family 16 protein [Myriangium duriaei CBS 260.36]
MPGLRGLFGLALAAQVYGAAVHAPSAKFSQLVSFGDSYTDDSRLSYFISHNGSAPPVGYANPANYMAADGGRPWPQYVYQYAGIKPHNYAVSGAVCSNNITPRFLASIHGDFPDVEGYEIPAFLADKAYTDPSTGKPFLTVPPQNTVYSMFIGTNDLGVDALLTDSQVPGTNITSYIDCVFSQLSRLYQTGARYFVIQNVVPLQLSPLYGLPSAGGVAADNYWPNKSSEVNVTAASYRMLEEVVTVNEIYALRTAVEVQLQHKFPGAHFALMSMYDLVNDIYHDPGRFLNGTTALSVDTPYDKCSATDVCTKSGSPDSYLWYDDLHPSEQTERNWAKEFLNVIHGNSAYATYFEG